MPPRRGLAKRARRDPSRREPRQGSRAADRFDEACGRGVDQVLTLDADGQHDPAYAPVLLKRWTAPTS